jgi:hypothetical protein
MNEHRMTIEATSKKNDNSKHNVNYQHYEIMRTSTGNLKRLLLLNVTRRVKMTCNLGVFNKFADFSASYTLVRL